MLFIDSLVWKSIDRVSGLQAGREFVLVVRAIGDEGLSPPVVLTAFTLTDNAQTVIGEGGKISVDKNFTYTVYGRK